MEAIDDELDDELDPARGRRMDPGLMKKRDLRGEGNLSQITAEEDAGSVEHVYQTASGEERSERISAKEATMVPSEANTPIVQVIEDL